MFAFMGILFRFTPVLENSFQHVYLMWGSGFKFTFSSSSVNRKDTVIRSTDLDF